MFVDVPGCNDYVGLVGQGISMTSKLRLLPEAASACLSRRMSAAHIETNALVLE